MNLPRTLWTGWESRIFDAEELRRLQVLRSRYYLSPDVLTASEVERLRFLRWLVETGRLHAG